MQSLTKPIAFSFATCLCPNPDMLLLNEYVVLADTQADDGGDNGSTLPKLVMSDGGGLTYDVRHVFSSFMWQAVLALKVLALCQQYMSLLLHLLSHLVTLCHRVTYSHIPSSSMSRLCLVRATAVLSPTTWCVHAGVCTGQEHFACICNTHVLAISFPPFLHCPTCAGGSQALDAGVSQPRCGNGQGAHKDAP